MVKSRRSVIDEKDRYGGFIPRADVATRPVQVDLDIDPDAELSFSRPVRSATTERPAPRQSESPYSNADYSAVPRLKPASRRKRRTVARETEDIMPSIKTQAYMTEIPREEEQIEEKETKQEKPLLNVKSKALLVVYIAAAVILATVVMITGISLSRANARVSALEGAIDGRNAVIAEQVAELGLLENDATLTGLATELGMTHVSTATEIELLPPVEPVEYAPRTNWFDKFCDWISGL